MLSQPGHCTSVNTGSILRSSGLVLISAVKLAAEEIVSKVMQANKRSAATKLMEKHLSSRGREASRFNEGRI
jgi:hypothetical protein